MRNACATEGRQPTMRTRDGVPLLVPVSLGVSTGTRRRLNWDPSCNDYSTSACSACSAPNREQSSVIKRPSPILLPLPSQILNALGRPRCSNENGYDLGTGCAFTGWLNVTTDTHAVAHSSPLDPTHTHVIGTWRVGEHIALSYDCATRVRQAADSVYDGETSSRTARNTLD